MGKAYGPGYTLQSFFAIYQSKKSIFIAIPFALKNSTPAQHITIATYFLILQHKRIKIQFWQK